MQVEEFFSFMRLCAFDKNPKIMTRFFYFYVGIYIQSTLTPKIKCTFSEFFSYTRLCAFDKNPKNFDKIYFHFDVGFLIKSALTPKFKCKF